MRLRSFAVILAASALLLLTGGPSTFAQGEPQRRSLFNLFWQMPERPAVQPRQRTRPAPQQTRRRPPQMVRDDPVIPKVDVNHHVLVVGDTLADQIAIGLADSLNDRADVAVQRKAKADSGLVRTDFYDWPKAVVELLAADPKIMVGVISLGPNDRQAIREGEVTLEPLSERWLQIYRSRVEAITAAFAARRVPLIWAGAPPMQNTRLSTDLTVLNDVFRKSVEASGGQFVDLWTPYLDAENRYSAMGPDVDGQTTRLRLGDGVHFTKAGARKAAHFVDVLIRRILDHTPSENVIALPSDPGTAGPVPPEQQPGAIERLIDRMVSGRTDDLALVPVIPVRPLAGPILPLTGAPPAVGESALLASIQDARGRGDTATQLDRIFGDGVAPEPKPGRADDFRWPRPN